jgi:probable F420-dependent oxidoreductase
MRFSYAESMTDPTFYAPLARAAEEAGYHSMVIPDSICYPLHADSRYPYNPDGTREFLEDKAFLEPFSLIPALGMITSRIRFTTFVVKVPIRNPVLLAKQVTSTAVLTGNRLILGVGTSPWREDYDVLGVDWANRGRRLDESIAIVRGLAAGGYLEYHGEIYDVPAIKIAPVPSEPIPVLIGGHSDAALRRAARLGDGWMHGGGDPADLPRLLARLAELRRQARQGNEGAMGEGLPARSGHRSPLGSGPTTATAGNVPGAAGAVPGLRPGEGAVEEGLPIRSGDPVGGSGPTTATTGNVLGAVGAVPGLRPGEGDTGEGLPRAQGGSGGDRSPREYEVHVISADAYTVDGVHRLEEQGVTDVIIGFRWPYVTGPDTEPLGRKLDSLRRFADNVIAKM